MSTEEALKSFIIFALAPERCMGTLERAKLLNYFTFSSFFCGHISHIKSHTNRLGIFPPGKASTQGGGVARVFDYLLNKFLSRFYETECDYVDGTTKQKAS